MSEELKSDDIVKINVKVVSNLFEKPHEYFVHMCPDIRYGKPGYEAGNTSIVAGDDGKMYRCEAHVIISEVR